MTFRAIDSASLSVGTTTARVALPAVEIADDGNPATPRVQLGRRVRLQLVSGGAATYYKTGDASVVADTADALIQSGAVEEFDLPIGHTHIAAIVASGTSTLKIDVGGAGAR